MNHERNQLNAKPTSLLETKHTAGQPGRAIEAIVPLNAARGVCSGICRQTRGRRLPRQGLPPTGAKAASGAQSKTHPV